MNSQLKITFLGTGTSQGIPIIGSTHPVCLSNNPKDKRLRVSIMLSWDDKNYVIDCGPDFRQQMLRENVTRLDGILFTHDHSDHTAGLDDIRPFNFLQKQAMPLYAEQYVIEALQTRFQYIFATENKYPGAPSVTVNKISENQSFILANKKVEPIRAYHGTMPVLGFKVDNFTYLTDVKTMEAAEIDKIRNSEILVINALRIKAHHSHFNLQEALDFIAEVAPKKAYLTHISHMLGFHDEMEKQLPKNVFLAYDGLQIKIP